MIHAGVQQIPVVGYQNKALLSRQIPLHRFSGFLVQMVRGLVDQKKIILPGKQHRQQHLRALSRAQRPEGPVQDFRAFPQKLQLADHAPQLAAALQLLRELRGGPFFLFFRDRIRKIIENRKSADASLIGIFSEEQVQKGRLPLPVAPDQPQLPVRVDDKGHVLENIVKTAFISEGQMVYSDL